MDNQEEVPSVDQGRQGVRMLYGTPFTCNGIVNDFDYDIVPSNPPTPTRTRRLPLLEKIEGEELEVCHTSCQVEVFSVRIDQFDRVERRGEIFGSIEVVDIWGGFFLYDRRRENPEHTRTNETICLCGSPRSISIVTGFAVNLDIRLRQNDVSGDDVVVCQQQLSWDIHRPEVGYISKAKYLSNLCQQPEAFASQQVCEFSRVEYNKLLSAVFRERNGCVISMEYAIFQYAVQAYLEVEIVHFGAQKDMVSYDVRGSLVAVYKCPNLADRFEISLLEIDGLKSSLKAQRWVKIPLSRCMMAVPAFSNLVIKADLLDNSSPVSHQCIAKGFVEFKPYQRGCSVDYITGENELGIRLLVTWKFESTDINSTMYTL